MSDKENRSIAYIYDEMDPSEKLEFERDLQNDSNLLIEVESFKKVSSNLDNLQHVEPPAHVVDSVLKLADDRSKSGERPSGRSIFLAVAAVLLVGMTSGIYLIENGNESDSDNPTESASVGTSSSIYSEPVHTSTADDLEPWVDNNEILYFNGLGGSEENAAFDSIRSVSFKKLTPVTDPSQISSYQNYLQLTGNR